MLQARINEKKAELEHLKQLKDLSGGIVAQMQTLEEKLSMLSDGTEGSQVFSFTIPPQLYSTSALTKQQIVTIAVAMVLSNWHNILRVINMASSKTVPCLRRTRYI